MNRRSLLRALAGAGALSAAGCVSGDGAEDGPTDTDEPEDTSTATDDSGDESTGTPTDGPTDTVAGTPPGDGNGTQTGDGERPDGVTDQSFSVTGHDCGSERDDASVDFGDGVTVTGTIWGNNLCYTAELRDTRYSDGELVVAVAAFDDSEPETACAECIAEVDYEVSVAFEGDGPDSVTVAHIRNRERTTVATAER